MSAALPAKAGGLLPIAGICCLALTGFLIATTVVLALIPIYTPRKTVTVVNIPEDVDKFQLSYSTTSTSEDDIASGSIGNLDEIRSKLGLGDEVDVSDGFVQAEEIEGSGRRRRRRSLLQRRQLIAVVRITINIVCRYKIKSDCRGRCRDNIKAKVDTAIVSVGSLSNIPLVVMYGSNSTTLSSLNFAYSGIAKQPLPLEGFGAITDLDFVPIADGDINDPKIWKNGIRPSRGCRISVPAGRKLSIPRSSCRTQFAALSVAKGATLELGKADNGGGFRFSKIQSLTISGTCSFLGTGGSIQFPSTCAFSFSAGAIYSGVAMIFQAFNPSTGVIIQGAFFSLTAGTISFIISLIAGIISSGGTTAVVGANTTTAGVTDFTSTTTSPSPTGSMG